MLNTLQFNMSVPTPYVFMRRFLKAAQSEKKVRILLYRNTWVYFPHAQNYLQINVNQYCCNQININFMEQLEQLSFFLIELSLVECEMLKFPPSLLAAAAVYAALSALYGVQQWSKTCEWHTSYSEDQLLWVSCNFK